MPLKVLVATHELQGQRRSDVCDCGEGEVVIFPFECKVCQEEPIDGGCGCMRSFMGIKQGKHTTTAQVELLHLTLDSYQALVYSGLCAVAWIQAMGDEVVITVVHNMLELASKFQVGEVLERHGTVRVRARQ